MHNELCPCGSQHSYSDCCEPIHKDLRSAQSAESLMRARYSAFTKGLVDFLYDSFHPSTRRFQNKRDIQLWATQSKWMQLEIVKASQHTVEFRAHYLNNDLEVEVHHEKSNFKQVQDIWYYIDGKLV
ncbi:YchJ family protein [Sphingobacterium wenxiniae]|uniref:SEC-C motif-containing protein n=1 Tax=Sphingobacterium wenxiniae TaxID=683125 RepID=A0A1I6QB09_9SPHI|nr:YchJ family metal-binding protein [Sphingobacterium wenxiniae]SFS49651.1 SEC-C motif-containing protein [Sphingobacterium wenxiniae]